MEITQTNYACAPENIAALIAQNLKLTEENLQLKSRLEAAEKMINLLIEQNKLLRQRQFGKKTENSKQLELELVFDEDATLSQDETETQEPEVTETVTYTRTKKTIGRRLDTTNLPREQIIHDLSDADKCCGQCGKELVKFGEDHSEQLEYIPATLKVIEHIAYKYTCRHCETVITAAKPTMPIAKSMAAPSLITEVIIKKFEHHLPWYRQAKIFTQDGLDIPANTICNWYLQAGEVLEPLKTALFAQLDKIHILQADETTVKLLKEDLKGYMWCYHSLEPNNRFLLFEYNDSRGGIVVNNTLSNYQGLLQTDGYSGYNELRHKAGVINLGCWAHCRRKFAEIVKIATSAGKAHEVVKWIAKLYAIEVEAKALGLDFTERKALRQQKAKPILDKIYELVSQAKPSTKSVLGAAITYTLNQWPYLIKYIEHGEAEIDNNWCENQIRPFAVGRKNWLFLGNERSAHIASFFYSIIQTCRINQIDPRKYLIYVLSQAGNMRLGTVKPTDLLPQYIDKFLLV